MKSLLLPAAFIVISGLVVLSSISVSLFHRQLIWASLGLVLLIISMFVDWHAVLNYSFVIWGLYIIVVILLILTYFTAPVIRGTRSWLVIGPAQFQPVELMKIALILVYASYFSRRHVSIARLKHIFNSFLIFALPAGLTLLQPDLGSAAVLFGIWFGFLLVSGLPRERVIVSFAVFLVLGVLSWNYFLEDYQRERILGVFYPERDELGVNYSAIQSKIAIGSAGLLGKGYGQGTQTQLGFLTEPATDFIFSALIEEWGVLGGLLVVGAFLLLAFKILQVGLLAGQNFEKFICAGATIVFGLQFLINVGSALGIVPVIGLPFPFLSYGGSSLLTNLFLLSIINSITHRA